MTEPNRRTNSSERKGNSRRGLTADQTSSRTPRMADDVRIVELRDREGLSFYAIASQVGLSKKSAYVRYYKIADADKNRIRRARSAHQSGMPVRDIAGLLGVHEITVSRWVGVAPRRDRPPSTGVGEQVREVRDEQSAFLAETAKGLGASRPTQLAPHSASGASPKTPVAKLGRGDADDAILLRLRDEQGLSFQEIASQVGMSISGARKRYYSAVERNEQLVDRARDLSRSGLSSAEIARRLAVQEATVALWTSEGLRPLRRSTARGAARPLDMLILRLRDEQLLSFDAIANRVNRSIRTVRRRYLQLADGDRQQITSARDLHLAGVAICEIAARLTVHEETVRRWTGSPQDRLGRPRAAALDQKIARLRDEDLLSFDVIAGQLGLGPQSVRRRYRVDANRNERQIQIAQELHRSGLGTAEIGRRLRVHEQTVRGWIAEQPKRGRPPRFDVSDQLILGLREEQGMSFKDIAERTGMSRSGVWARYDRVTKARVCGGSGKQRPTVTDELIRRLRDEDGLSFRNIADQTELSASGVQLRYYAAADADQSQVNRACGLYQSGLPVAEIADLLGVHERTVARWTGSLLRLGRPRHDVDIARIAELRDEEGLSFKDIARQMGLSLHVVRDRYYSIAHGTDREDISRQTQRPK